MADFEFISQKQMGKLRPMDRLTLLRMEKKYEKLVEQMQEIEMAREELFVRVAEDLKIDTSGPFRGMAIEKDGHVHVMYCPCVACQATLNNMTVADTTEAMISQGLIHEGQVADSRARASMLDAKRGKPMVH